MALMPARIPRWIFSLLFIFILTSLTGQAAPDSSSISLGYPVYSQYLQNGLVINPAYTGSRGALCGFLSYRQQWIGTEGAPTLQSASLHAPLKNDKVALGLLAQFMQYGYTKTSSIYASYAYHIRLLEFPQKLINQEIMIVEKCHDEAQFCF